MLDHHPEIAFEKEFDFVLSKVSDTGAFPPLDDYLEWIATVRGADYAIDRSLDYRQLVNDFLRQNRPPPEASLASARRCIATSTVSGSSGRTLDISTSYAIRATCPAQ